MQKIERLNETVKEQEERISTSLDKNSVMETWMYEAQEKQEVTERSWKDRMELINQNERNLRQKIRGMSSDLEP